MSVFVDTSALYALLDDRDLDHSAAAAAFPALRGQGPLVTHSYVLVEATALVQRRLGMEAVRALAANLAPLLDVTWVDEQTHRAAMTALQAAERRNVSLVDWTSFEVMRAAGLRRAFAFDGDFAAQGFEMIPS